VYYAICWIRPVAGLGISESFDGEDVLDKVAQAEAAEAAAAADPLSAAEMGGGEKQEDLTEARIEHYTTE
jgi:hypothetical protein